MCDLKKMLAVAEKFFEGTENPPSVSIGTKHKHSTELVVLIAGRVQFDPSAHRRDAWDVMTKFNLYVRVLSSGQYEAGSHDPDNHITYVSDSDTIALAEMAYLLVAN